MVSRIQSEDLGRFDSSEKKRILDADIFAEEAHFGQKRKSGKPYITHPRAVATYLIEMGVDADTVIGGLLHDTVEDTQVTVEQVEEKFGGDVARLVDGVTKLGQVDYVESDVSKDRHASSVENIRKLLLAMSKDMRVIMIKLADRRHNLKTLNYLAPDDQKRIAMESLEVFAPLADRLGMGALKAEIEDLAFEYAYPEEYKMVKKLVASNLSAAQDYIEDLKKDIATLLKKNEIESISIHGRQKHLYSVYKKLTKAEGDINKIFDLMAIRIIVPNIQDCYQVLGIIHHNYKPLIYRIKDYIAIPKPNGYRSLHTTVFASNGRIIEIQIRTPEMHKEAEHGMAAHSIYELQKLSKKYREGDTRAKSNVSKQKIEWIQELAGLSANSQVNSSTEMMDNLKIDLFKDRIFVFSPKGDLYDLPEGATPLDFAFAIHTQIGLRTQGARVNGRISPLDRPLENRDMVEIITRKQPQPNRQWLNVVKTASARSKIKAWFRQASRESNVTTGRQLLEAQLITWGYKKLEDIPTKQMRVALDAFNYKDVDTLLQALGEGSVALTTVLRRLMPSLPTEQKKDRLPKTTLETTGKMQVIGAPDLPCMPATCCKPEPPDVLVGYVTRGSGVTVHKSGCANIPSEPDRLLDCQWQYVNSGPTTPIKVEFTADDRMGLVHDITGLVLSKQMNIVDISTRNDAEDVNRKQISLSLDVPDMFELNGLIQQLKIRFGVKSVSTQVVKKTSINAE